MSDIATRLGTTTTGQLLVRSGIEIERILYSIIGERATVTARLPEHMFLSRLVSFDPLDQTLNLAFSDHKPANSAVLGSRAVLLMCNLRGAQFAFTCSKPRTAMHEGQAVIKVNAPKIMLAMQHGLSRVRGKVPGEADVRCELWLGVISFEARLVDMSLDGKAFLLCDPAIPVCAGTKLERSRIVNGAQQPLVVDIEVDHVLQAVMPDGKRATRIGCRVLADREKLEKLIAYFIVEPQ
jgi:hypothetical protein